MFSIIFLITFTSHHDLVRGKCGRVSAATGKVFTNDIVQTTVGTGHEAHDTEADDKRAFYDSPGRVRSDFGVIGHQLDDRRHDETEY